MSDEYWITHPVLHRQESKRLAAEFVAPEGMDFVVISSFPHEDDLFVCDICNTDVKVWVEEVYDDGEIKLLPRAVPCSGTYALCRDCFLQAGPANWQPTRVCACAGCERGRENDKVGV